MEAEPLMIHYDMLHVDSEEMKIVGDYVSQSVMVVLGEIGNQNNGIIPDFSMFVTQGGVSYVKVQGEDLTLKNSNIVNMQDHAA